MQSSIQSTREFNPNAEDNAKLLAAVEQYIDWKITPNHAMFAQLLKCCELKMLKVVPVFNQRGEDLFLFSRIN